MAEPPLTTIVRPATEDEIADAGRLLRALASWRCERRGGNGGSVAAEDEGRQSDREPAASRGRLLIAYEGDQPAGCATLCHPEDGVCAVEQLFVTTLFRGHHIGRTLVERLLLEARAAGYRRMRLDTIVHEHEAIGLCERTGFRRVDETREAPDGVAAQHVLFERDLRSAA